MTYVIVLILECKLVKFAAKVQAGPSVFNVSISLTSETGHIVGRSFHPKSLQIKKLLKEAPICSGLFLFYFSSSSIFLPIPFSLDKEGCLCVPI